MAYILDNYNNIIILYLDQNTNKQISHTLAHFQIMGNTDSRKAFKQGSLVSTLQHMHLNAGDEVHGEVQYKLLKDFPGEHITVELVGVEKVLYDGNDKKCHNPKHSGKIYMKREIIRQKVTLAKFDKFHVEAG